MLAVASALLSLGTGAGGARAAGRCPTPRDYPAGWPALIQAESSGVNQAGRFDGLLQFERTTWDAFKRCAGLGHLARAHHATRAEQIAVARYVMGRQGVCAWPLSSWRLRVAQCGYGRFR